MLVLSSFDGIFFPVGVVIHSLCLVFFICGLSLLSNPQSITYYPHFDNSRSPPTNRSNSYHVDTDFSIDFITYLISC